MQNAIQTRLLSSLEKVFPDREPEGCFSKKPSIFKNEAFNFQVAYYTDNVHWFHNEVYVEVQSPLKERITIKAVELVPSNLPCYPHEDQDYLTNKPGLLPDALMPLESNSMKIIPTQWRSLWFEFVPGEDTLSGDYSIEIFLKDNKGDVLACENFNLTLLEASLPKQKLIHTEWFHTDCLAQFYKVEVFSDRYWALVKAYMETASEHGMNMILTPLFTPPLDTQVNHERLTVQLVDVSLEGGQYHFNFDKLDKWIDLAEEVGIEYFEMSHLFTQWGAHFTPKIMVHTNGALQPLFGWHVEAGDESYKEFLDEFLPKLKEFLNDKGLKGKCYFHISDEPGLGQIDAYQSAYNLVRSHLEGYPFMDALSNLEFYEKGLVENPVCSNDHVHTFIEAKVPHLWTYYCVSQRREVSNRFMAMPSYRNRILGVQLFKYDIEGFLHWGYNFWNTQLSKKVIDPFKVTDAGMAFPSGDAFLVYPGEDGPIHSIRLKVLAEGLNDVRALELLASFTSKDYVLKLIEKELEEPITFKKYPKSATYLLALREKVNEEIMSHIESH